MIFKLERESRKIGFHLVKTAHAAGCIGLVECEAGITTCTCSAGRASCAQSGTSCNPPLYNGTCSCNFTCSGAGGGAMDYYYCSQLSNPISCRNRKVQMLSAIVRVFVLWLMVVIGITGLVVMGHATTVRPVPPARLIAILVLPVVMGYATTVRPVPPVPEIVVIVSIVFLPRGMRNCRKIVIKPVFTGDLMQYFVTLTAPFRLAKYFLATHTPNL